MLKSSLKNLLAKLTPESQWAWLSLLLFIAISIPITIYGQFERSGFILMTSPTEASHSSNSLLGFSDTIGEVPVFKENIPFIKQVMMFGGIDDYHNQSFYVSRPMYAFLVSLITPLAGIFNSFIIINYLSWTTCAWITWRFTKKVFQDELASFIAVIFVSGGLGLIVHIGDYSAHLIGFSAYYLGVLILYESEVWFQPISFKTTFIDWCLPFDSLLNLYILHRIGRRLFLYCSSI